MKIAHANSEGKTFSEKEERSFPWDLVGIMRPVPGWMLRERGYSFFREDRTYQLDAPDQNGIVRVFSQCREVGPEEDGYGAMEYFDWWMMDTNLEPIPGVRVFRGYSSPDLFGTGMKGKWQEQYELAVAVLKSRSETNVCNDGE